MAREMAREDGEGVDAVRGEVTCDTIPCTAIDVFGSQDVGVVEGLLKTFMYCGLQNAEFGESRGDEKSEAEEGEKANCTTHVLAF